MIYDIAVLGAGAAGMMAAAAAASRGGATILIDHAPEAGKKILISGGGRCNFTNLDTKPENFLSANRHFARSALARYTPRDFLALVERHRIAWHEKSPGQLFCDESARLIVDMLLSECRTSGVTIALSHEIRHVERGDHFITSTNHGDIASRRLILATGGLSIPKLGATDLSLRLARQFGLGVIETAPALVPLTLSAPLSELAGVSLPVTARIGKTAFSDGMIFTHRGLSGPAILQISSYRRHDGAPLTLDLMPGADARQSLLAQKKARPRAEPASLLSVFPQRLARHWANETFGETATTLANVPDRQITELADRLRAWTPEISGTEGYLKAEVMRGGIDTAALSSQTMEARDVPGLYAIGEAVDVTGWLGGYNFQWAWASGRAAGLAAASF